VVFVGFFLFERMVQFPREKVTLNLSLLQLKILSLFKSREQLVLLSRQLFLFFDAEVHIKYVVYDLCRNLIFLSNIMREKCCDAITNAPMICYNEEWDTMNEILL
jgi:hypothetical protein